MDMATILLVEDNRDDVELTLHALRKNGMGNNVVVVRDGQEALDYLFASGTHAGRHANATPDLVLLDLNLPKISGLDVLRAIRADPRTKRIPVVILTTSDDQADILGGYDLGTNSYVRKPVDFDEFYATVKELETFWLALNTPPPR
jgi:two-component system, response regulator